MNAAPARPLLHRCLPLVLLALLLHAGHGSPAHAAGPATQPAGSSPVLETAQLEDRRDSRDSRFNAWLANSDPGIRARAALALGRIGEARSTVSVAALLADREPHVRATAAFALGLIADSTALEPLSATLSDADSEVRRSAVEALSKLGTRRAAPLLGRMLTDPARAVRLDALVGLWRVQDSAAVDATLPLLQSAEPRERQYAVYALERSGSRRAGAAVRALAADPDEEVRMWAVRAIGRTRDLPGEARLIPALRDPSWRVRCNAAAALGALGDSATAPALAGALGDSSGYVRQMEATALGQTHWTGGVEALSRLITDPVASVRAAAGQALARILGKGAFRAANPFLSDSTTFVAALTLEALGEAKCRDAWEFATWASRQGAPRLVNAALSYFGSLQDGHGMPMVMSALRSTDPLIAANAASVLGGSGDSTRTADLEDLYTRWPGAAGEDARLASVDAATQLRPKWMVPLFLKALKDPAPRVRAAAAAGLKAALGQDTPDSLVHPPLPADRAGWFGAEFSSLPRAANLHTSRGTIRIAFERELSPNTAANFCALARRGYFSGLRWHRVVPNFVIQGGDPHGDGEGGPGYSIRCEMNPLSYDTGRVGMALSGKDTGGSQFFITQSPQPHLNGRYTIFARVEQGMDVVDRIEQGDVIRSVELVP